MPVDSYVAAEILATCNALGSEIRGVYVKNPECLSCLKDLILFLRRDDEDFSVLRQLGELRLLQTDLLPILKQYHNVKEIFDMTLRLLVIITNPAFLLFKEEIPVEKTALNVYLFLVSYLQNYKQAFTDVKVWEVLYENLKMYLSTKNVDRDEEDRISIERIIIIIRNVLHVPPTETDRTRTDDDASLHDQVLWALHLAKIEDFLLYISQNDEEHQYCLHVIEIISLMLREQTPQMLVKAGQQRSVDEKREDEIKLMTSRQKETDSNNERKKVLSSHRFNGIYCIKNMKSISDRDYISHKFVTSFDSVKFDTDKVARRTPKNRIPASDNHMIRRSTMTICLFLKKMCCDIINNSYNLLMASVKRTLMNKKSDEHDDSYYLWAIQYFLEFNRLFQFQLDAVSETVSVQTFHFIQTQIDNYYDMLMCDKKKVKFWSKRMHLALKAYKELLHTLFVMSSSEESTTKASADVIKSNIFYVVEYRELLPSLFSNFDEVRFSSSYLVDLVEATHLFLKMLDQYAKGHSQIIVQRKKRKRPKKKKQRKSNTIVNAYSENENVNNWNDISSELSAALQGRRTLPTDIMPFDAISTLSPEEQQAETVFKIKDLLFFKDSGKVVALLRAARDLWPENNSFGATDIGPEEEFMMLREIFLADVSRSEDVSAPLIENEEDDEDEELVETTSEQKFAVDDFLKRFASPKIVRPCCLLLANYKKNSTATNTSLLKLMHRIAWDMKMYSLFFQASVFVTFRKILHDTDQKYQPIIKELSRFAKFVLNKFFENSASNPKVFVEMMFWKGTREAYELEEGYGTFQGPSTRVRKQKRKRRNEDASTSGDLNDTDEQSNFQELPLENSNLLESPPY